jgi:hypothetical protein
MAKRGMEIRASKKSETNALVARLRPSLAIYFVGEAAAAGDAALEPPWDAFF